MTATVARALRLVGAALLLAAGAIHVALAFDGYGTDALEDLFLVNGAASAVVAGLVVLVRGPLPPLAGLAVSAGSLLALALSRTGDGIAGFRGTGLDPMPEVPLTIALELAGVVLFAALAWREREPLVDAVAGAGGRSSPSEQT